MKNNKKPPLPLSAEILLGPPTRGFGKVNAAPPHILARKVQINFWSILGFFRFFARFFLEMINFFLDLLAAVLREHVFRKKSKQKRKCVLSRGSQFFFEDFRAFSVVFPGFVCRGYSGIHVSLRTIMLEKH